MLQATPFQINISQEVLDDLQARLARTRWPEKPAAGGWTSGTDIAYLKELTAYWQTQYDWRKQEAELNHLPQFTIALDGTGVHFVHVKSKKSNAPALLLTHGWPDSFFRFYKVIPMLAEDFDVVVPSIPGFGFSDPVALSSDTVATLWSKLMKDVLGYDTYFAAGGDIGSIVTKSLANQFPKQVKAIHLTDVGYPTGQEDMSTMSAPEQEFASFIQRWFFAEGAYNMIQSTKPQTLAFGLNDSPVGLAAWILEKFKTWSDHKDNLESCFTKDELLTNIMIYWVTQTIYASVRMYQVDAGSMWSGVPFSEQYVKTPAAVAVYPAEAPVPIEWAQRKVNVQRFDKKARGGHFAALEVPEEWSNDLKSFFLG